jgi:hypothetical protein
MHEVRQREPNRLEALAWLQNAELAEESDRRIEPYLDAAAVLDTFSPGTLRPAGEPGKLPPSEVAIALIDCARPVGPIVGDVWRLDEPVRRAALRRLGSRAAMRRARAANPASPTDPVQQGIDLLIHSDGELELDGLSLDQLLGVERAAGWFSETLSPLPPRAQLAGRIERERHLAPMRKIAGAGFVDRSGEREQLASYVGVLPPGTPWQGVQRSVQHLQYLLKDRPPLHLHGPGGVGKSALLARFILDHADPRAPQPLPFIYLDFDRAALDPPGRSRSWKTPSASCSWSFRTWTPSSWSWRTRRGRMSSRWMRSSCRRARTPTAPPSCWAVSRGCSRGSARETTSPC